MSKIVETLENQALALPSPLRIELAIKLFNSMALPPTEELMIKEPQRSFHIDEAKSSALVNELLEQIHQHNGPGRNYPLEANMKFTLECEKETDGRWLAEVPELPGSLAYGVTPDEAMKNAEILALRVLADRIEQGDAAPLPITFAVPA